MPDRPVRPPEVSEDRLEAAVAACVKAGAELVYLFGSQARGKVWAQSDVDLAVLLGPNVARERHGEVRVHLIAELMSVFESNSVDVVILNEAPPLLTYEGVIQGGRLLHEAERLSRIRFEVRAFQEYVDTAPLRELQDRYLKDAIRRRAATLPAGDGGQGHPW
ncbi:MAG TPA: nucleotidyltransferase domain-containing protein [Candidatus Methylomirabilis sp.]|nr:nucleotidyltransferase domain-containing protein [Candidatus Methylomirabilis sp.]